MYRFRASESHHATNEAPPSYRLHKARNCAVVTINGRNHYSGPYGSPESYEEYNKKIAILRVRILPQDSRVAATASLLFQSTRSFWGTFGSLLRRQMTWSIGCTAS